MKPKFRNLRSLAIASSVLLAISYTHAATLYWDGGIVNGGDPAANANGGAGNWNNALTNWDTLAIAGANSAWTANDTAVFGGTAGTVTLTDNVTAGGLTFNTTGYALASDDGLKTLTFAAGNNTILFNNIAAVSTSLGATAGLKLGGTGNVILSTSNPLTAGTLTLQYAVAGDHSLGWSGTTTINPGMILALNGRDLSLSSTTGITLSGGGITLNNTNSTQGAFDRVASVGITSNGGTFNYSNTSGVTQTYAETIGVVDLVRGQLNFVETATMGAGNIQTLTLSGLTRTGATNTSAVTFGSASGLGATNVIKVNGITTSTTAGQIVGPWATVGTPAAGQTDYAIYTSDGSNATVALASTTLAVPGESGWSSSTTAYRASNTAETLTATRTAAALRYTAGAGAIALGASNFNLETYGLLNGGGGTLTVSTAGTGALTTPTGGGNLYLTTGTAAITVSAPIKDNGGAVTLVKSGTGTSAATGTLTLSGTNTFTGGVVLNAGTLTTTSDANLGTGGVTVNGTVTWGAGLGTKRSITINEGGVLTLSGTTNGVYSGLLSGSGALANNQNNVFHFTNAGNSLTGQVNPNYGMFFANIGDSSNAINIGNTNGNGGFGWTGGTKTLASRVFTLNAAGNGYITANGSGALTIQQNLAISGTAGARTLNLQGSSSGLNTFSGNIADGIDGGASVVGLSKGGTGAWALSATNTYSGITINAFTNPAAGSLVFQGMQALSNSTTLQQTHAGGTGGFGTIKLLDDSASPASRSGVNVNMLSSNTSHGMTLFVGNNNTANGGNSAGATTGSTITLGNLNFTQSVVGNTSQTFSVTGANGYGLQFNNVNLPGLVAASGAYTITLNPTTAPLTVAGNVQQAVGNVAGTMNLTLGGTALGNQVTGNILNSLDGTPKALSLTKSGSSIWTLQGTNTYTGTTTVSGGKLLLSSTGSLHASSAVTVSGGALGGTGTVNGTVTVSSTGGINLRDNAVGNLTLASTLDITGAAGANNLSFDLGNGTGTSDSILAAGTTSVTTTGAAVINLNQLNGVAGRTATTYTLIGGAGTLDATNFAKFTLATTAAFGQTYALTNTGDDLQLVATNAAAVTVAGFWAGGSANWSSAANWKDALAGAVLSVTPDYSTNVTFSATSATLTNTLDTDFNINSLTFTDASGNVTIGGTKTLTIQAAAVNGNTLGNGIDSQKTTGTNTISAKVGLASSQTWTVAGGGTLAVSGSISDFGNGYSLTKAGLGDLNLSGVNTYSGATNITAGILRLDNASALAGTSGVSITSGASLFVRSVSPTLAANQSLTLNGTGATGTGALVISTSGTTTWNGPVSLGSNSLVLQGGGTTMTIGGAVNLGSNTLTLQNNATTATTISGAISGSGGLIKQGTGTGGLVLTGANTYTGNTAIEAGTLSLNPTNTLGGVLLASSAVTLSQGATLQFGPTTGLSSATGGYSLAAPITLTGGAGTANIRFGSTAAGNDFKYVLGGSVTGQSGVAQTLALFQGGGITNGDRQNVIISGAIADGASGGTLAVTVDFAGTSTAAQNAFVNLTGQSTFTGNLIVNNSKLMNAGATYAGAWMTIGGERWIGNGTNPGSLETVGTGTLGSGGVYNGNITINTGNGVNGTGITTLSFLSSANQTLGGTISGAGNLRQDGTGTLTLTGTNDYTGTTTVNRGTLKLGANNVLPDLSNVSIGTATLDADTRTDAAGTLNVTGSAVINLGTGATLAFAPGSPAWTGTLNITGNFVSGSSLRFGTTNTGLTLTQLGQITGVGAVTLNGSGFLVSAGGNTYADWLALNAPATGFVTDSDNDGISNGVENVLGTNPNTYSAGLTQVSATANSVVFKHTLNPSVASDVTYSYQWSTDMVEWKATGQTNTGGTTATISASAPVSGVVTVTITITGGPTAKLFGRLVAVK